MAKYFEKMKARPSFKPIPLAVMDKAGKLNSFKITLVLLLISCILAGVLLGIATIFTDFDWKIYYPSSACGIFLLILLIFVIKGCRMRSAINAYRSNLYKLDRNDPEFVKNLE